MAEQTSNILFSFLIANYNNGCFLQETIDSILRQSYPNWEVIIVDDNSTDNSADIYSQLTDDSRFHVFYNNSNHGVGYTKKRCIDCSHGEICGFIDPDDVLVGNDVIDSMVTCHLQHPEAALVYSGMYRADENLNIIKETPGLEIPINSSALKMKSWPIHHFATFKRSLYYRTEGMDPMMKRAVDYDLYYKLEEVGSCIHLPSLQYIQRANPHSISLNNNSYKAAVWHTYSCIKSMKRRNLDDESLMLFPVEHALRKAYLQGYEKATSSRIYRIGKMIAFPVLFISKLWKK